MKLTSDLFEAYLKCPTKCYLRSTGQAGSGNAYAEWVREQNDAYQRKGVQHLVAVAGPEVAVGTPGAGSFKTATWRLAMELPLETETMASLLHVVERVPSVGRGRPAQFIPFRFTFFNKLTKDDRLLVAFDALLLSELLGREIGIGKIIHGDDQNLLRLKVTSLLAAVHKVTAKMSAMLSAGPMPDLILNRHCGECEFRDSCRQKAVEKDDLSLLGGMTGKERKKYHSKGIFTIAQLSYTFRPRRRPKRLRDKREKFHHSLRALAIREKKIHIVGNPELKIEGTPVYLDVEGLPDRDFYYLIGLRIGNGKPAIHHSLWADTVEDEGKIWRKFLGILETVQKPMLMYYGSYETRFLRQMRKRYGNLPEGSRAAEAVQSGINLLSRVFAQVYFSSPSNGLKDIADSLGFTWAEAGASGLVAIARRYQWEELRKPALKEQLIMYNAQDCEALNLVAYTICQLLVPVAGKVNESPIVVRADADQFATRSKWRTFVSPVSGFEYINNAAHWSYQRSRIYARSGGTRHKPKKRAPRKKFFSRIEKVVYRERSCVCPKCNRRFCEKCEARSRTLQDVLFGHHSLKRRLVRYVFQTYRCRGCGTVFGVPERFQLCRRYGWNLMAYFFYQIVELCVPQIVVVHSFNRLFGFELNRSTMNNLKIKAAQYYEVTKQLILERIVRGELIHADETRANVKGKSAFVWVLTSFREVVYVYAESREGEIIHKLLADFKGVLVTDFYTAYESIDCKQQKCLIHLMRDLNDEVLNNPFDEPLKQMVTAFGGLLKSAVETVDRYGLKRHFLRKHLKTVDRFYNELERTDYQSEAASKCKERFQRNRDTLFTFLSCDAVPWNNNNAEHAIKAFARLRDVIAGSSTKTGVDEYLTLLSVCQTCKYIGVDFLDFLRSGEKDIHTFAESRRRRRRRSPTKEPEAFPAGGDTQK